MSNELHILKREEKYEFRHYNDTCCEYLDGLQEPTYDISVALEKLLLDEGELGEWQKLADAAIAGRRDNACISYYDLDSFVSAVEAVSQPNRIAELELSDGEKTALLLAKDCIAQRKDYSVSTSDTFNFDVNLFFDTVEKLTGGGRVDLVPNEHLLPGEIDGLNYGSEYLIDCRVLSPIDFE